MGLKKRPNTKAEFEKLRKEVADEVSGGFVESLLQNIPVESGHAHEAICSAIEGIAASGAKSLLHAIQRHANSRSGDATASKTGNAVFVETIADHTLFQLIVDLPFVKKLDKGGKIQKISPKGKKAGGLETVGQLYSPRTSRRKGWLFWIENGVPRFALTRIVPPHNFTSAAFEFADNIASSHGFKEV